MTDLKKWEILNSQWAIDHQWCKVRQDTVRLPNGTIVDDYFVHVRPEIVLVVPVTPDNQIVFVHQYRHGVQEFLLELPAGSFESTQEDAPSAAKRELEEETGYMGGQFIPLITLYDNPVKDTNKIHVFLALEATATGRQQLDPTEEIEIVLIPVEQMRDKIENLEITVSGSLAAIYLALDYLSQVGLTMN
jgi:8-oxo-dGTP pyrophosphatase MutT (NUDIX family)